jgi:hypothetical protein
MGVVDSDGGLPRTRIGDSAIRRPYVVVPSFMRTWDCSAVTTRSPAKTSELGDNGRLEHRLAPPASLASRSCNFSRS